jgi:hypothetical protein
VVVAREDQPGDKRLVAYVIPRASTVDPGALRAHLESVLPEYMVPSHFVSLREFPQTPNRKIDRNALPAPQALRAEATPHVAPEGELQSVIADVWQRVLGTTEIGVDDNFFELGGHSLLAVQAHRRLHEVLHEAISVTDIFRFPTVRTLAEHLGGGDERVQRGLDQSEDRARARREAMQRRRRPPRGGGAGAA